MGAASSESSESFHAAKSSGAIRDNYGIGLGMFGSDGTHDGTAAITATAILCDHGLCGNEEVPSLAPAGDTTSVASGGETLFGCAGRPPVSGSDGSSPALLGISRRWPIGSRQSIGSSPARSEFQEGDPFGDRN